MRFFEITSTISGRVNREAGLIHDVMVLGAVSQNGRTYSRAAMRGAVPLYEGRPVYVDHDTTSTTRGYRDKIGRLINVRLDEAANQIRADLAVNPEHPTAAQLFWDAANNPAAVGLSHDAEGTEVTTPSGERVVESIARVRSVDLVADPATTRTLYESIMAEPIPPAPPTAPAAPAAAPAVVDPLEALYQQLSLDTLKEKRPDLLTALKQQIQGEIAAPMGDLKTQLQALQAKLDEYIAAESADQQMTEARLDPARVPPRLRESIRRERDAGRRKALIEEVQRMVATSSAPVAPVAWPGAVAADPSQRASSWRV